MAFILNIPSAAHANRGIQIVVNVPAHSPANSEYFITGGAALGCNWQPDCHAMKVVDEAGLSFGLDLNVPDEAAEIEFKITRGSWDSEAADAKGRPLGNQVIHTDEGDALHILSVVTWKDLGPLSSVGRIVDLGQVYSPQLKKSHGVTVLLPATYSADGPNRFPVIYMHDGQNLFDPKTSTYGVSWDVGPAMSRIALETGLEAIVVGIESSSGVLTREHEYDYAYRGADYASFLIDTLKPLIDAQFKTKPGRESTFTAGASMGATISIELVWVHPEVFSKALGFSLPANVHHRSIFHVLETFSKPGLPIQIYVDHGGCGEDHDYLKGVRDFIEALKDKGLLPNQISYAQFRYHDHTESDWARRLERPLRWLLEVD